MNNSRYKYSNKIIERIVNLFLPTRRKLSSFHELTANKIIIFTISVLVSIPLMIIITINEIIIFNFPSFPVIGSLLGIFFLMMYLLIMRTTAQHNLGASLVLIFATIATIITVYQENLFEIGNLYWILAYIFFGVYVVGPSIAIILASITIPSIGIYLYLVSINHQFPFEFHYPKEVTYFEGIKTAFIITLVTILSYIYERSRRRTDIRLDETNRILKRELFNNKIIQKEKDEIMDKLINSEKLASLGVMAGGIAHEINNPLAIIEGTTRRIKRLLNEETFDRKKIESYLEDIDKVTERVVKVVNGLKTFARDGTDDPFEDITIADLINGLNNISNEKFKSKGIDLIVDIDNENATIECKIVQIEQVLVNLLNNAYDSVVNLPEKWIRFQSKDAINYVEITITDSGPPIPANVQGKIMYPFFTTKPVGKGTGLGLSISRGIIENHLGSLALVPSSFHPQFVIKLPKKQPYRK